MITSNSLKKKLKEIMMGTDYPDLPQSSMSLIESMLPHLEELEAQSMPVSSLTIGESQTTISMSSLTIGEAPKSFTPKKSSPIEDSICDGEEKAIDEGFDYVKFPELSPDE